jgi:hypothetical protein
MLLRTRRVNRVSLLSLRQCLRNAGHESSCSGSAPDTNMGALTTPWNSSMLAQLVARQLRETALGSFSGHVAEQLTRRIRRRYSVRPASSHMQRNPNNGPQALAVIASSSPSPVQRHGHCEVTPLCLRAHVILIKTPRVFKHTRALHVELSDAAPESQQANHVKMPPSLFIKTPRNSALCSHGPSLHLPP